VSSADRYPRRLIEVDLPIKRISAHARREKAIRHGHISTLHIWWARRPLAACRAVVCASLWPDPADELCPERFRNVAREQMQAWACDRLNLCGAESWKAFVAISKNRAALADNAVLRQALLDFIADFANWDNSSVREYLETSQTLTQEAHEALGGAAGTRPLVVDPFAGGGSIPLEALRVGADAFASDLNPIPVLLNKVVLEYVPKYGQRLADEVRRWGEWVGRRAEEQLSRFYPKDVDGATTVAYLWARRIKCEGPGCGADVPLIRSLWLSKKAQESVAIQLVPNREGMSVEYRLIVKQGETWVDKADSKTRVKNPKFDGTVKRGSATCPCCGYTTPVARVREQLKAKHGGAADAAPYARVILLPTGGRTFRLTSENDARAIECARSALEEAKKAHLGPLSLVPNESTAGYESFVNRGPIYGMTTWEDYFTPRQALALATLSTLVRTVEANVEQLKDRQFANAVTTVLALAVGRCANQFCSLCKWNVGRELVDGVFARQALPMLWDFGEINPLGRRDGFWMSAIEWIVAVLDSTQLKHEGHAEQASADRHPLPDDCAAGIVTDPPYYYSVQYADLSDFFYVWLRRILVDVHPSLFVGALSDKTDEIIVQSPGQQFAAIGKNNNFFLRRMSDAMAESRRIVSPGGIGVVVFAHSSTAGWEAQLQAMIEAGWIITGSWPIDTELASRVISQGRSVLASSVHLVCRPREHIDGSIRTDDVGAWSEVLQDLPRRIHEWMPRLAEEGVVGADAIFACLGPALEVYSRYSRVEKAGGQTVSLKEYLVQVWAAVAREALSLIFEEADATGLEEDARLTAMWLWTMSTGEDGEEGGASGSPDEADAEDNDESTDVARAMTGLILEFDAARKIAQGLGVHLEALKHVVEIKGDEARLLSVAERTRYLFGGEGLDPAPVRRPMKAEQLQLFEELVAAERAAGWGDVGLPPVGKTTLNRVHQAMILFGAGRGEALRRFLVDGTVGRDGGFWKLAQSLSALYPAGTDEKRWVGGVLARKKGLGFG